MIAEPSTIGRKNWAHRGSCHIVPQCYLVVLVGGLSNVSLYYINIITIWDNHQAHIRVFWGNSSTANLCKVSCSYPQENYAIQTSECLEECLWRTLEECLSEDFDDLSNTVQECTEQSHRISF